MYLFLWGIFLAKKRNESIVRDMKREFPNIGNDLLGLDGGGGEGEV
jgi:hypothetical protein